MNPVLESLPVKEQKRALARERRARRDGDWGNWERLQILPGQVGGNGWTMEVSTAYRNKAFSVLRRETTEAVHLAITSLSEIRPSWPEMQRIKDELAGPEATAVEVYPPHDKIVDDANMYHLWVLPQPLPFNLEK